MYIINDSILHYSQDYFEKHFSQSHIDWKKNSILPRVVTVDNRIRVFQERMLFKFGIVSRSLCSFCNSEEETPFHIFHNCTHTKNPWNQLQTFINENLVIPCLTPQSAMFGFIDTQQENRVIINHLLLIFKFKVCKSRDLKTLNFLRLKSDIINIRHTENLCKNDIRKQRKYFKKWIKLINLFCH